MGVALPSTFGRTGAGLLVLVAAWLSLVLVVPVKPVKPAKDTKLVFGGDGRFKIAQFADRKHPISRWRRSIYM